MVFLVIQFIAFLAFVSIVSSSGTWSYSGDTGPEHWEGTCKTGIQQSPINIDAGKAKYDPSIGQFLFSADYYDYSFKYSLSNNGHSITVAPPADAKQTVRGGGLPGTYQYAQFHFHWGSGANSPGSEHTLDKKQYPAEVHIVHYNTAYNNLSSAATEKNGLAVIGAFIEVGEIGNAAFNKIFEKLGPGCAMSPDSKCEVTGFRLIDLLPFNHENFFRYQGSLTTPGCYESVVWTMFQRPITITQEQLQKLFTIKDSHSHELVNNFRPVQKLNKRTVSKSFLTCASCGPSVKWDMMTASVFVLVLGMGCFNSVLRESYFGF